MKGPFTPIGDGMTRERQDIHSEVAYVSFADLVRAKFDAPADFQDTRRAFIKQFGPIVYYRFGENIACGVALTDHMAAADGNAAIHSRPGKSSDRRGWLKAPRWERRSLRRDRRWRLSEQRRPARLHLFFPVLMPTTAQAVSSLSRCQQQAVYARRFLEDEDLRQCLTLLYWPADALIALVDTGAAAPASGIPVGDTLQEPPANKAATREPTKNDVAADDVAEVVNQQLNAADQYYQQFTQRTVRSAYFRGIGYGLAVAIALFVVLYLFRKAFNAPAALLWSILAGALGALTSVLSSATFGRIVLDRPQGGTWNTFLGAFRPLIGSLFGAAFFALISAGFLPIKVPTGNGAIALYASIAFLAGFSHRWAQDTLKAAEGRITTPPSPSEGRPEQGAAIKPTQTEGVK
jgi:hypothetical protein